MSLRGGIAGLGLLDRDAFREVSRLIHIATAAHGDVVREQLQRDRQQHRHHEWVGIRHRKKDISRVQDVAERRGLRRAGDDDQ